LSESNYISMEFVDLKKQYLSIKEEIDQAIQRVLNSGKFILDKEVEQLEKEVAKYCRARYAVGVNSGTDALFLSLMALDIGSGDEVITTPFTFISTAEVIALRGARPVFVDINPRTFNVDSSKIEEKITKKTKAIIPVHLYGQSAEMEKIIKIARKHNLYIIEDVAQAVGAKYKKKMVGSIGDLGCFSFFPSKNLGAYGDGGMILTNNKKWADKIKALRAHGAKKKYFHEVLGINSRLDSIQATILNVKLKYLAKWIKSRQEKAKIYNKELKNVAEVKIPPVKKTTDHAYHQYTIRVKNRDRLKKYLEENKIPTMIYYLTPLHLQPVFKYLRYNEGDFPEAEKAAKEVLSLPIYPELSLKEQILVIKKIKEFYS